MKKFQSLCKACLIKVVALFLSLEKQAKFEGVRMGKRNFVKSHFWSTEPYLITIGNDCAITSGVSIYTHGGGRVAREKHPNFDIFGKVQIGNRVYIGSRSLIMPGVTIGDNVLIAAGSVVTKSIPSNSVVAGNPAKYICTVDEYIEKNMKYNVGTKGLDPAKKKRLLLDLPEDKFLRKGMII